MTPEQEKMLADMYYDARWGEVGLRLYGVSRRDIYDNDLQWQSSMTSATAMGFRLMNTGRSSFP